MFYLSPDEIYLKNTVELEVIRDAAHRRGRKRNPDKLFSILQIIRRNDVDGNQPLSTKAVIKKLPEFKEDDIEDHLQFLSKFPKTKPFLLKERIFNKLVVGGITKRLPGGFHNVYRLNEEYRYRDGQASYLLDTVLV